MEEIEISTRLRAISIADEWPGIIKKCYGHVQIRLKNRTKSGAHCEQRLGMPAHDYYVGNAIKAIYEQSWEWKYEKYDITTQLSRIINSMISNEVRRYKAEQKHSLQLPLLIENDKFDHVYTGEEDEDALDEIYHQECSQALQKACEGNHQYQQFIKLKMDGKKYSEIAEIIECTLDSAYQIMETIGRRTRKIMTSKK